MNEMLLSILLIIFGLICGFGLTFLVAYIREGTTSKKIDKMLRMQRKMLIRLKEMLLWKRKRRLIS